LIIISHKLKNRNFSQLEKYSNILNANRTKHAMKHMTEYLMLLVLYAKRWKLIISVRRSFRSILKLSLEKWKYSRI